MSYEKLVVIFIQYYIGIFLYTVYYELKNYHFTDIAAYIGNHSNELLGQQDRMTQQGFKHIKNL